MSTPVVSDNIYIIYAYRKKSQFGQKKQVMRCKVLEAHSSYLLVESLKRYNKKYSGASMSESGQYSGKPIRRINRDQAAVILDEKTGDWLAWGTVQRREGTSTSPGRARGGK
jgi:hypothetical protein